MASRRKEFPCIRCDKHVGKHDKSVECSLCNQWVHFECEPDLTEETYKVLCTAKKANARCMLYWTCSSCTAYATKFNSSILELNARLSKVEGQVDVNSKDIESIKDDIDKMQDKIDTASGQCTAEDPSAKIFSELRDRESRKNNVILHNVSEPTGKNKEERQEEDKEEFEAICEKIGVVIDNNSDCKFMTRLGKFNSEKSRPLLVGMKNTDKKNEILENARKLKNENMPDVKIVCDLTKQQRQEESDLKIEATKKNDQLSEEDKKNYEFQVVGRRGERRIARVPLQERSEQGGSPWRRPPRSPRSPGGPNNKRKR